MKIEESFHLNFIRSSMASDHGKNHESGDEALMINGNWQKSSRKVGRKAASATAQNDSGQKLKSSSDPSQGLFDVDYFLLQGPGSVRPGVTRVFAPNTPGVLPIHGAKGKQVPLLEVRPRMMNGVFASPARIVDPHPGAGIMTQEIQGSQVHPQMPAPIPDRPMTSAEARQEMESLMAGIMDDSHLDAPPNPNQADALAAREEARDMIRAEAQPEFEVALQALMTGDCTEAGVHYAAGAQILRDNNLLATNNKHPVYACMAVIIQRARGIILDKLQAAERDFRLGILGVAQQCYVSGLTLSQDLGIVVLDTQSNQDPLSAALRAAKEQAEACAQKMFSEALQLSNQGKEAAARTLYAQGLSVLEMIGSEGLPPLTVTRKLAESANSA